ncbi:MAG: hypothetical protein ACTTJF_08800 [Campylobacter sp.]|uniref:hypothetical protein n=1 Tax=Campylobacter sp. TaxID=205 RepID=UPI003FA176BE
MKKIIVLSLALAVFLGAKEIKSANIFLSDVKSVTELGAFLKANKDEIVKLNLSYCANKNSRETAENEAESREDGGRESEISETYKLKGGARIDYTGIHYDIVGYDIAMNAGVKSGDLTMVYKAKDGREKFLLLQALSSQEGEKYKWEYLWDETAKCVGGEVRLEGAFYIDEGKFPQSADIEKSGDYDIFSLDPVAKKYFKLLEYK